jgi:hypothetical protein
MSGVPAVELYSRHDPDDINGLESASVVSLRIVVPAAKPGASVVGIVVTVEVVVVLVRFLVFVVLVLVVLVVDVVVVRVVVSPPGV